MEADNPNEEASKTRLIWREGAGGITSQVETKWAIEWAWQKQIEEQGSALGSKKFPTEVIIALIDWTSSACEEDMNTANPRSPWPKCSGLSMSYRNQVSSQSWTEAWGKPPASTHLCY